MTQREENGQVRFLPAYRYDLRVASELVCA